MMEFGISVIRHFFQIHVFRVLKQVGFEKTKQLFLPIKVFFAGSKGTFLNGITQRGGLRAWSFLPQFKGI